MSFIFSKLSLAGINVGYKEMHLVRTSAASIMIPNFVKYLLNKVTGIQCYDSIMKNIPCVIVEEQTASILDNT